MGRKVILQGGAPRGVKGERTSQWGEGKVVLGEQKELPNKDKGCSSGREVSPKRYVPKGGVKLRLRMHYIPLDVPRDWMDHQEEKSMGFPGQYGSIE